MGLLQSVYKTVLLLIADTDIHVADRKSEKTVIPQNDSKDDTSLLSELNCIANQVN